MTLFSWLDALIDRERVRNYSAIILTMSATGSLLNAVLGPGNSALSGPLLLGDYLAHWTGGRLLLEGHADALYDPAVQAARQQAEGSEPGSLSWFVSPPVAGLLYVPFACLSYGWSALVWTVVSVVLLLVSVNLVKPLLPASGGDLRLFGLVFLATPPVFVVLGAGQDSTVALVALAGGLRLLLADRPGTAGVVLALGLVKPHLFVLVPVALLLQRRYRTLLTLSVTCAGLVLLSLLVAGLQAWRDWVAALTSPLYTTGVQAGQTAKMQSLSGLATAVGAPPALAYVVLLAGVVALALRLRSCRYDTAQVWSATVLTTLVFSPHVMVYDLVLLLPVLALAHAHANTQSTRLLAVALVIALWSVPLREGSLQAAPGWSFIAYPWSALLLLALWLLLARGATGVKDRLDEPLRSGAGGGGDWPNDEQRSR